ncbi:MAG: hypothetical protein LBU87_01830 [Lactobacillales bacterium]|jgi:hypothetical protein|nr:hypothetical protein [Lactobacillales bacterium]
MNTTDNIPSPSSNLWSPDNPYTRQKKALRKFKKRLIEECRNQQRAGRAFVADVERLGNALLKTALYAGPAFLLAILPDSSTALPVISGATVLGVAGIYAFCAAGINTVHMIQNGRRYFNHYFRGKEIKEKYHLKCTLHEVNPEIFPKQEKREQAPQPTPQRTPLNVIQERIASLRTGDRIKVIGTIAQRNKGIVSERMSRFLQKQ